MAKEIPYQPWLMNEIIDGLSALLLLNLPEKPALDSVEMVANVWYNAITAIERDWDEVLDTPRVRRAYQLLSAHSERWPIPKQFLDSLPARPEPKQIAAPKPTEEQRKENLINIRKIKVQIQQLASRRSL